MDIFGSGEREREIEAEGRELLRLFDESMKDLPIMTSIRHSENLENYVMRFLVAECTSALEGAASVSDYFELIFPCTVAWASPEAVESMAESIRLFYRFLADTGRIPEEDYDELAETIRGDLPRWKEACENGEYYGDDEDGDFDEDLDDLY